jgi:hypothetical protein
MKMVPLSCSESGSSVRWRTRKRFVKVSKFLLCNHLLAGTTGGERIADFGPRELLLKSMRFHKITYAPSASRESRRSRKMRTFIARLALHISSFAYDRFVPLNSTSYINHGSTEQISTSQSIHSTSIKLYIWPACTL